MKSFLIILTVLSLQFSKAGNAYAEYTSQSFIQLADFNGPIDLSAVDVDMIEAGVFYLSNIYREQKGKSVLTYNENLSDAAYLHSVQMEKYNFFNHVNRKNRILGTLEKRVLYAGYSNFQTIAENIFYGYIDLSKIGTYKELCSFIVDNFVASKEHRLNILSNDIKEGGNGIFFESNAKNGFWYFYFTQDFGSQL